VRWFLKLWLLILGIKLGLSSVLPFFSDEAYYWIWARHLQLSYYDHPPMIAWLLWIGSPLDSILQTVRWPAVIIGHLSLVAWYLTLAPYMTSEKQKFYWILALSLTPLTGIGSIIMTPDLPLIVFWSFSILSLVRIFEKKTWHWYLALGVFLGLGFSSKYHIVIFLPIALGWILWTKRWKDINWKFVPLTLLGGFVFSLPVLIWNYRNDFISFAFQLKHGLGGSSWKPEWTLNYLLGQIALIFPPILYLALRKRPQRSFDFLPFFAWGPILFFALTSFKGRVEANWTAVAYPAIISLAVLNSNVSLNWIRRSCVSWLVLFLLVLSQIFYSWIPTEKCNVKTNEMTEYSELTQIAKEHKNFYAGSYQMASILSFHLKRDIYKLKGVSRLDFFDYLKKSSPTEQSYFLAAPTGTKLPDWALQQGHQIVGESKVNFKFTLYEVRVN